MPLLSFYMVSERERLWLDSVDHTPTDWLELQRLLAEAMAKLHRERGLTEALVTLERHLPGRAAALFIRYRPSLIPYKREFEAAFKLRFSPRTGGVEIAQASFNYTFSHVREDFWWMERGIRWKVPPVIPKEHQNVLSNPKYLLMDPSATRYADYSGKPRSIYSFGEEGKTGPYIQPREGIYVRMERRLSERQGV